MPSDHELLRRVTAGDHAAFDALFARHEGTVRERLVRMVRDEAVADDLVQEVFLRVWTRAETYAGRAPFGAWLARVAVNLALNHLRSRKRRRQQPLEPPADAGGEAEEDLVPGWMIDESAPQPEQALERRDQVGLLRRAFEALSDEKREVLRLVHEDEASIRDAAALLGIPEGTVKSRLHYALRDLARAWKDIDID